MNPVTVELRQVLIVIPALTGLYCLFCNRAWIWDNKRSISHAGLILLTLASIIGIPFNDRNRARKVYEAKRQERIDRQRQERRDWEKQTSLVKSQADIQAGQRSREACEDPKQLSLPGEWWNLYKILVDAKYYETKFTSIESFVGTTPKPEPLSMIGFDLILAEFHVKDQDDETWKHIRRVKEYLEPYLTLNAQTSCYVEKTEGTVVVIKNKTEEKVQQMWWETEDPFWKT